MYENYPKLALALGSDDGGVLHYCDISLVSRYPCSSDFPALDSYH